ncbi:MAG: right-handed parallel beta-helix repeat-containing protein [Candidatus Lokiarchaeota archaeon]|nr:right-handed parallel beta-helix repeat-containing protein [Candidatus Lokiarchaeota archaeon]
MNINNSRKKVIILTLIVILPTISLIKFNLNRSRNYQTNTEDVFSYPKISWDYGNGSIDNPHVLENKTFVGTGSNGYFLYDKTFHFIIRNCTFIDSGTADDNAGLKLVAVQNGIITNNTFTSCQNGIYFAGQGSKQCKNNVVYGNKFISNLRGIRLWSQAKNINITYNIFWNNMDGIKAGGECNGNNILYNNFSSCNNGIEIANSQTNLLENNRITGSNFAGIYFYFGGSHTSSKNLVKNSDLGILLDYTTSNTFSDCDITNNDAGIWFQSNADNNLFYNNTFAGNTLQGQITNSYSNSFSYNGRGNSWDDYDGFDCNNDGIGETPYVSGDIVDNYPLCSRLDTFDPIVSITEPIMESDYESTAPSFALTIQEYLVHSQWYTLDGGITNYTFTGVTGDVSQALWDNLAFGDYNLTFYIQDLAGNVGSATVVISKEEEPEPEPEPQIPLGSFYLPVIVVSIIIALLILRKKYKFEL